MKINELRVGNMFYRHCCNDEVMEIRTSGVIGLDSLRGIISLDEMQPIELTEEFFKKNGFILTEDLDYYGKYFRSEDMRIEVYESSHGWVVHIDDKECSTAFAKCLKYVHELQNAYYISTGEELEIKL
jgi:hypothetical protein